MRIPHEWMDGWMNAEAKDLHQNQNEFPVGRQHSSEQLIHRVGAHAPDGRIDSVSAQNKARPFKFVLLAEECHLRVAGTIQMFAN